jgi:predicted dehydrogenase
MKPPVQVALVGVGGFGIHHLGVLRSLASQGEAALAAVVVRDPATLRDQIATFEQEGVSVFTDYTEMLQQMRGKVTLVSVVTGLGSHAALGIAALRSGYNVLLDKPPAATLRDFDGLVEAARASERQCAVLFQWLSFGPYKELKDLIVSGALGQVRNARCMIGSPRAAEYYTRNDWAGRWRNGGEWILDGPMHNALSHELFQLLYLSSTAPRTAAKPIEATCEMYRAHHIESEDTSCLRLVCDNGATVHFYCTHSCLKIWQAIEIECDNAVITEHRPDRWDVRLSIRYRDGRVQELRGTTGREPLIQAAYENVVGVLTGSARYFDCPLDLTRALMLATNGAHLSARRPVQIPEAMIERKRYPIADRAGSGRIDENWVGIRGVEDVIQRAFQTNALFSELDVPWARRSTCVALPDRFELESLSPLESHV